MLVEGIIFRKFFDLETKFKEVMLPVFVRAQRIKPACQKNSINILKNANIHIHFFHLHGAIRKT